MADTFVLVDLELDGGTYRFSRDRMVMTNGTVYQGGLKYMSNLRRSLGGLLDPRLVAPTMEIVIDISGGAFADMLSAETLENRPVTIQTGPDLDLSNYTESFVGVIQYPPGPRRTDTELRIPLSSNYDADDRNIPTTKYDLTTYPNMDSSYANYPIQLVYGSYLAADGDVRVPAVLVDSTVNTGGKWMLSARNLKSLESVKKNGAAASIANVDEDAATFELAEAYTSGDIVSAHCEGCTDDGTTSGDLIQTFPAVCLDILDTYLGVPGARIDSTYFDTWEANLSSAEYIRRVINVEILASKLISQLCVEGWADLTISGGKYRPVYRVVDPSAGIPTYYEWDIQDRGNEKDFEILGDVERVFINEIALDYEYDAVNAKYQGYFEDTDDDSISNFNMRRRRRIPCKWIYKDAGAQARGLRELLAFSGAVQSIKIGLKRKAIAKEPTDQFNLVYSDFGSGTDGDPFQLRSVDTSYKRPGIRGTAWNVLQLTPGRWAGSHVLFSAATEAQKNQNGFWRDTDGTPTGCRSKWF